MCCLDIQIINLILFIQLFAIALSLPYHPTTIKNESCEIPFMYQGTLYHDCTTANYDRPWCYVDKNNNKWEQCKPSEDRLRNCNLSTPIISLKEINEILFEHNSFRGSLPALNMRKLEWNTELAQKAQYAAEKCSNAHTENTLCNLSIGIGQNLFYTYNENGFSSLMSWKEVIGEWTSEQANFDMNKAICAPGKLCGHFTQVAWYNTQYVGCGKAKCITTKGSRKFYIIQYFCNYFLAHISPGAAPYKVSHNKRCQDCHLLDYNTKFQCNKDYLCEKCDNISETCMDNFEVSKRVDKGLMCADTNHECDHNAFLCNKVNSGQHYSFVILNYMKGCKKTCKQCT